MSRTRMALWACLYAALVLYVSTVVSPTGFSPKPLSFDAALQIFLAVSYVPLGSDQRADWVANLLMLAPLGFLLAWALGQRRGLAARIEAAIMAFALCTIFVLGVKFVQVFFPRTVNLNYIAAQIAGSLCGILAASLLREPIEQAARHLARGGRDSLAVLLGIATLGIAAFMLVPFDIVVSRADMAERLAALPDLLLQIPGAGRPLPIRLVLIVVGVVVTAPIGMLLALLQPRVALGWILLQGLAAMSLMLLAAACVMSASPALINIPLRSAGILAGAILLRALARHDIAVHRRAIATLGLILPIPYLLALVVVNGLATPHWRGIQAALDAVDNRFFLPLWTDYIVTKAQAIRSVLSQMVMYAPVGVMLWMRGRTGPAHAWLAALLAALLSAAIELARWLKPGLAPDINNPVIAAIAAHAAVRLMPFLWNAPRSLSTPTVPSPQSMPRPRPAAPPRSLAGLILGGLIALTTIAAAGAMLSRYPLSPAPLAAALTLYAIALWIRPSAWLIVLPVVIPALQLTPWTGWMITGESDLFVLVTLGVLWLRTPPRLSDWALGRPAAIILLLFLATAAASIAIGTAVPEPTGGTSDIYMSHWNGLRLAKPLLIALVLLPFAARRHRTHRDLLTLLAAGMIAGLCATSLLVVLERLTFAGLLDFTGDYRVMGPFASMHVGGGHIGAYLALALPFSAVLLIRPRAWKLALFLPVAVLGGYALVVTFARTAYAAALIGTTIAALGLVLASTATWRRAATAVLLVVVIGGGITAAALSSRFMAERIDAIAPDFAIRAANWADGLALQATDPASRLFGMGAGSYLRLSWAAQRPTSTPTDFAVQGTQGAHRLVLHAGVPLYFGQKINALPGQPLTLSLKARAATGTSLDVAMCEKLLLYSMNCAGHHFELPPEGPWTPLQTTITMPQEVAEPAWPWLHRPAELAFFTSQGAVTAFTDVHLRNAAGDELIANGDFADGTSRWYFTADNHIGWRILDQYLMTTLENGAAGLLALAALIIAALAYAVRALRRGNQAAACCLGALAATLVSFVSDATLESLSLATLIYLVIGAALIAGRTPSTRTP